MRANYSGGRSELHFFIQELHKTLGCPLPWGFVPCPCADSWLTQGGGAKAERGQEPNRSPALWQGYRKCLPCLRMHQLWRQLESKKWTTSPALKMDTSNNYSEITKALGLFSISSEARKTPVFKTQAFSSWECMFWRAPCTRGNS